MQNQLPIQPSISKLYGYLNQKDHSEKLTQLIKRKLAAFIVKAYFRDNKSQFPLVCIDIVTNYFPTACFFSSTSWEKAFVWEDRGWLDVYFFAGEEAPYCIYSIFFYHHYTMCENAADRTICIRVSIPLSINTKKTDNRLTLAFQKKVLKLKHKLKGIPRNPFFTIKMNYTIQKKYCVKITAFSVKKLPALLHKVTKKRYKLEPGPTSQTFSCNSFLKSASEATFPEATKKRIAADYKKSCDLLEKYDYTSFELIGKVVETFINDTIDEELKNLNNTAK